MGFRLEEKRLMKFLSVKSTYTPIIISIFLILIKIVLTERIYGYDRGYFPTDVTYSVFAFYIWFSLLCISKKDLLVGKKDLLVGKKDLLVSLITFKKIPKKMFTQIKKIIKKETKIIDEETKIIDEETKKEVPLINYIVFHFLLFAMSFTTFVYNLARLMGTISFPLMMLLTIIIVYFFPYMLAKEQI